MAAKKSTYEIEIDATTTKAVKGIKDVGTESEKASKKIDLIADALEEAASKGTADLEDVRKEAQNAEEIFVKLATAVGDDLGGAVKQADLQQFATQLSKAGVEATELDGDIDRVAASLVTMGKNKDEATKLATELEDAQRKAKALDDTDIDVDVKTDKVKGLTTDLDASKDAAGRAQAGIGTLRGVTDELGGAAGQIGTYGAAMVDAGETVEIFGEKLGLSEGAAAKLSAGLGTFAVGATAAVAIGAAAWAAYNDKQEETKRKTAETSAAMTEQLGLLEKLKTAADVGADSFEDFGEAFTAALVDSMDDDDLTKTSKALVDLGLGIKDLGPALIDIERNSRAAFAQMATDAGVPAELADGLAKAVDIGEDWNDINQNLISAGWTKTQREQYKGIALALEELNDQQQNNDADTVAKEQLALAAAADTATAAVVAQAIATNTDADGKTNWVAAADVVVAKQQELTDAAIAYATEQRLANAETEGAANFLEQEKTAEEEAAAAALAHRDALLEMNDARRGAADAAFAAEDAAADYRDTLSELGDKVTDAKGDQDALNEIYRDGTTSAADMADANVALGQKMAEAGGKTLTATEKMDIFNNSMVDAAGQASGPLRQSILDYIATTNNIPAEKMTEIQAAVDRGDLTEAQRLLNEASAARTAAILADAETTKAEQDLNYVARSRDAYIIAKGRVGAGFGFHGTGEEGVPQSGMYRVGERGTETLWLPRGTQIDTAAVTSRRDAEGGNGDTYITNYYQYLSTSTARDVRKAERRAQMRGLR